MFNNVVRRVLLPTTSNKILVQFHLLRRATLVIMSESLTESAARNDKGMEKNDAEKKPLLHPVAADGEPPTKITRLNQHITGKQNISQIFGQKRKKFAILLAYCGAGYFGMQRQPGNPTIEECLLEALLNAKLIGGDVLATPGLAAKFQRAARTDKGVSAASQLVSLQMSESIGEEKEPASPQSLTQAINQHLPEHIRVINVYRVTRAFDSKDFCCARTYCYTMPTYALQDCNEIIEPDGASAAFRIDRAKIDAVNAFLQNYKGTHNFHNFTSGLAPEDKSANRYLIHLECGQPFIASDECDPEKSLEFITISIKGQSFMLHQIRKMIALMICTIRGTCSIETLGKAWGPSRVDIPMAPALGLYLNLTHFDGYNKRFGNDGVHVPLDWEAVKDEMEAFKTKFIIGHIVRTELAQKSMLTWLGTLNRHSFDYNRVERANEVPEDTEASPETNEGVAAKLVEG